MAKRKPRKPYRGIITTPAPKHDPSLSKLGNAALWGTSAIKKLDALCEHHGIDRDDFESKWFMLALRLAEEYVPDFAPAPIRTRQGRRPDPNSGVRDVILVSDLFEAERNGKSVANAARLLVKRYPKYFGNSNPETLRERYYLLKDREKPEHERLRKLVAFLNREDGKLSGN